jgi:anti-anti-sigma regulatory factor
MADRVQTLMSKPNVLDVRGTFNRETAQAIRQALTTLSAGAQQLVLDLSRADAVPDSALGMLAAVARDAGPARLVICGLTDHARRILVYLGVDPLEFESRAPAGAPEAA